MSPPGQAVVLPTHTPALFEAAVARAAALLRAGDLVALPTETVYGLAANALDPAAVAKIFAAKARPADNPVIVHVDGPGMARRCVADWSGTAERLARAFWPGPLTLVLPRAPSVPDIVTAGGPTVAVRFPAHPLVRAVIRACDFPLAAPSANMSGRLSPTNSGHVQKSLGDRVALIVDGGQCQVGIESTVLDLTTAPPQVLRPGMIHADALAAAIGGPVQAAGAGAGAAGGGGPLRSPGTLSRHYAPKAKLITLGWRDDADLQRQLAAGKVPPATARVLAHTRIPSGAGLGGVSVIPHDPGAFARALYAELHRCDDEGVGTIVVEALPDTPEWRAVQDRLSRAGR